MFVIKLHGFDKLEEVFNPDVYTKAARSTISKLATQAKTEASTVIRETFNIKKKDLDPKIDIRPPRYDNLTAIITASGKPISLTYFGAKQLTAQNRVITRTTGRQLKRASKMGQGVTVNITKSKVTRLPKAFIATMKSGYIGVFTRVSGVSSSGKTTWLAGGHAGRKIAAKAVVTLATMFGSQKNMDRIVKRIQDNWPSLLSKEIDYYLSRIKL